jgi:hypothetical protein
MDVRQWLETTEDRAPPEEDDHPGRHRFLQPGSEPALPARKYRRKRKRAPSDSSIIQPRCANRERTRPFDYPSSSDGLRGPAHATARARSPTASQRSSEEPVQRSYEKRPRHKTKADRYDPKPKKQRKERRSRGEGRKSEPKRRKSHRSGDGGRTRGLVKSFQLKNGPKNQRLTVRTINAVLIAQEC